MGGGDLRVIVVDGGGADDAARPLDALSPVADALRWATAALSWRSEPLMTTPALWSTSASGDMDTPPIPTRWAWAPGRI